MSLTKMEADMLEAWLSVRDYLTKGRASKAEYFELMSIVHKMIKLGENKKFGCPTGTHSSECTCVGDKVGASVRTVKAKKK